MKSSLRPSDGDPNRAVTAWKPAELNPSEPLPAVDISKLLDLFKGIPGVTIPRPQGGEANRGGVMKESSGAGDFAEPWSPEVLVSFRGSNAPQSTQDSGSGAQGVGRGVQSWMPPVLDTTNRPAAARSRSDKPRENVPAVVQVDTAEILKKAQQEADRLILDGQLKSREMLQEASQILQQAIQEQEHAALQTDQAAALLEKAHQESQAVREHAYREGLAAAQAETENLTQTARAVIDELLVWRTAILAQSENDVVGMIKEMAQIIFGEGLVLENEPLQQAFNRVMSNARSLGDLRIYINPNDAINLGPYWRESQAATSDQKIQLIPSEAIKPGGCFVEGQMGSIDARIETQLKAMLDTLTETQEQPGGES